jgi:hypothetical protein
MPKLLTAIQVAKAKKLRAEGYSLTEIATAVDGKPDRWTSIYYHVRHIPPPPSGWKRKGNPRPWSCRDASPA